MSRAALLEPEELLQNLLALADAAGRGGPLPMLPTAIPDVWLDGECLAWGFPKPHDPHRSEIEPTRWLTEFIVLADAAPRKILGFARRNGPLGICWQHCLPLLHEPGCDVPKMRVSEEPAARARELLRNDPYLAALQSSDSKKFFIAIEMRDPSLASGSVRFLERLSGWRLLSRWVRSLLYVAAEVKAGRPGDLVHWRIISKREPEPEEDRFRLLVTAVNVMMSMAQPTPMLSLSEQGKLTLGFVNAAWIRGSTSGGQFIGMETQPLLSGALFSAIVVATASTVATGRALTHCSECGALYTPDRSPVANRLHFCRACRAGGRASRPQSKRRKRAEAKKARENISHPGLR